MYALVDSLEHLLVSQVAYEEEILESMPEMVRIVVENPPSYW